jgi:hypothetical protein
MYLELPIFHFSIEESYEKRITAKAFERKSGSFVRLVTIFFVPLQ